VLYGLYRQANKFCISHFEQILVVRLADEDPMKTGRQKQYGNPQLSSFGPRLPVSKEDATLLQRFAIGLTSGMLKAGIRRVVIESTAFLFKDAIIPPSHLVGRLFFPSIVRDACEMENVFRKSGLDWTIVRPPRLTDKPRTGKYRVQEGRLPYFGFNIARAEVADFLIKAGENGALIGKVIVISN
jgi:hypothetical protein